MSSRFRYHLGRTSGEGRSLDTVSLVSIYKQHFSGQVNPRNFHSLLSAYMSRSDLGLAREIAANGKPLFGATRSLQSPVLNMTGGHSPHVEATVAFNGRLQPNKCTWMKIQDAAMVLEEQPGKVAEAVKLFLQGLGFVLRPRKVKAKDTRATDAVAEANVATISVPETAVASSQENEVSVTNDLLPGLTATGQI